MLLLGKRTGAFLFLQSEPKGVDIYTFIVYNTRITHLTG